MAAVRAIAGHVDGNGRLPTFVHGHWLAVPVLRAAGMADLATRVLDAVENLIESVGPTGLAWLATTVPDTSAGEHARAWLATLQQADSR